MKKYMQAIFIISVLFIICAGLFGVLNRKHKSGGKLSYYKQIVENTSGSRETKQIKDKSFGENTDEEAADGTQEVNEAFTSNGSSLEDEIEKTEKEQYRERLDSIITYYDELWADSASLAMTDMKELKNQEYTKWDDELNTIYQMIKKKLPEEEFIPIRDEERKWITIRDEKAAKAASKYAGGTMEGLEYMAVMTEITRERTYELVEIYFEE
jgi:uncharacterized protein YecT (DUF1311 family)